METRLLREAKAVGATVVSGLEMFVGQAAQQFELFTGKKGEMKIDCLSSATLFYSQLFNCLSSRATHEERGAPKLEEMMMFPCVLLYSVSVAVSEMSSHVNHVNGKMFWSHQTH